MPERDSCSYSRDAQEWWEADSAYNLLRSHLWPSFSILGTGSERITPGAEIDRQLKYILDDCPWYYPALFDRGEFLLRMGSNRDGEELVEKAFQIMREMLRDDEEFEAVLTQWTEVLGHILRYDLAAHYMERALTWFPETAIFYDHLAFYRLQLPERDKDHIVAIQQKALELDGENDYFISNLGWIYLVMNDYEKAGDYFHEARRNRENAGAEENLQIVAYMTTHRVTYIDYLLRAADRDSLKTYFNAGAYEDIKQMYREYNADRLEAFKTHYLQNNILPPHRILRIIQSSEAFATIMEQATSSDEFFFYENIDLIIDKSRDFILRPFIKKSEEDSETESLSEAIFESLPIFYHFLMEMNRITEDQYNRFKERMFLLSILTRIPPPPGVSIQQIADGLSKISEEPSSFVYHPVLFQWGKYLLTVGNDKEGERWVDRAFHFAVLAYQRGKEEPARFARILTRWSEELEVVLRHDLAAKYIEIGTHLLPDTAEFYDYLASAHLQMPSKDKYLILKILEKALDLEPFNGRFLNHMGLIYLMMGNYEEAKIYFNDAIHKNSKNSDAGINMGIAEYMEQRNISYFEYLLRPVDKRYLESLLAMGECEAISGLCQEYNIDRVRAYKMHRLQQQSIIRIPTYELFNMVRVLENFISVIDATLAHNEVFLFEDVSFFIEKSRYFIYQCIENDTSENPAFPELMFKTLDDFYGFLWEVKMIEKNSFEAYLACSHRLREEITVKIPKYEIICQDDSLDQGEKETMIRELFRL
ncbi:MAG: tetratricopeptide repeat protein [Candidatus Omnitrophota bacterium]